MLALQVPWKPRAVFHPARARVFFGFGWKLLASGILEQAYQGLSDLLIGKVFNTTELGYVSQGKKYPQALGTLLDGAIQPVMLAAVSRVQGDIVMVKRLARRALKTSTYLVAPCMLLFALVARPIVIMLLGEQWLPSVPFLQMYCIVYAMLPIHTTNLQVLNGMGRSDLFLKLEILKKVVGIVILCFTTFVLRNLYAIVGGYIVSALICTFINASPNKRVIGYDYLEQVRDICPAFVLAAISAVIAYPLSFVVTSNLLLVAMQLIVMFAAYCLLSKLFHVEEFEYLFNTIKGILSKRV